MSDVETTEEEEFEKAFANEHDVSLVVPKEEPEAEPEEVPEEETEAEAEPEEEVKEPPKDDWEEKYHQLQRRVDGRYGEMNDKMQRLEAQLQQQAPTPEEVAIAISDPEKLNELKEEFPEYAAALEDTHKRTEQRFEQVEERWESRFEAQRETYEGQVDDLASEMIEIRHPGWEDTIRTGEFSAWYQGQDEDTHALGKSERPRDSIKLLDKYRASLEDQQQQQEKAEQNKAKAAERLDAAAAVPTSAGGGSRRKQTTEQEEFENAFKTG